MSVIPVKLVVFLLILLAIFTEVELGCGAVDKSQGIFNSISDPLLDSCFDSDPIDDVEKQSQEDACKSLVDIYKAYTEQVLNREENAQIPFWPWQDKEENVVPNTANSLYVEETFDDITEELTESKDELLTRLQDLKQELQNQRSKLDAQRKNYLEDLAQLKKFLNAELEQLKTDYQGLITTLEQHEDDLSLIHSGTPNRKT